MQFTGRETLTADARARIAVSLRSVGADVIGAGDVYVPPALGAVEALNLPFWHERQRLDHCASHAVNSFFGCTKITGEDVEVAKTQRRGEQAAMHGSGLDFYEVQALLAVHRLEFKLLSFVHTRDTAEPYTTPLEWATANAGTFKELLGRPRFVMCSPGHYVAVHRGVLDTLTPFCLVDSCAAWQSVFSPTRLVQHLLTTETRRASCNFSDAGFSTMFAVLPTDVLLPVSLPWITRVVYQNAATIQTLLDVVGCRRKQFTTPPDSGKLPAS